jgi:hypothetical protein
MSNRIFLHDKHLQLVCRGRDADDNSFFQVGDCSGRSLKIHIDLYGESFRAACRSNKLAGFPKLFDDLIFDARRKRK